MNKEKSHYNPTSRSYYRENSTDIYSSRAEASDTENVIQTDNLSADNSNISRSSLSAKSIDLNDDDDNDDYYTDNI